MVDIGRLYIIVAATTSITVVTNIGLLIAPDFEHEVSSDAPLSNLDRVTVFCRCPLYHFATASLGPPHRYKLVID